MKYNVNLTDKTRSNSKKRSRTSANSKSKSTKSYKPKKVKPTLRTKARSNSSISYKALSGRSNARYSSARRSTTIGTGGFSIKNIFGKKPSSKGTRRISTSKKLDKNSKIKRVLVKFMLFSMGAMFFGGIILFFAVGIYLKNLQNSLPDPEQLISWNPDQSTIVYDRNGKELYKFYGDENREFVALEEIPEHVQLTLLAAEDSDFYQHKGIDIKGAFVFRPLQR